MGCSGSCSADNRILLSRGCGQEAAALPAAPMDLGSRWSSLRWYEQFLAFPHLGLGFACSEVMDALHADELRAASSPTAVPGEQHLLHLLNLGTSRPPPFSPCFLRCGCAAY